MEPLIRATSLHGFADLVRELGGDPLELARVHGIGADAVKRGVGYVPITMHDLMLDEAARQLGAPDFGLQLASRQDASVLGPLTEALRTAPTVADAWRIASTYMFVHSPALNLTMEEDPLRPGGLLLVYRKDLSESPYSPQALELGLGVTYVLARQLLGDVRGLRGVEITHGPRYPIAQYSRFFGVPVRFDAPVAGLRFDADLLDVAFATVDATQRREALEQLAHYRDPRRQVAARVRRAVAQGLGTEAISLSQVARMFAVHPRTLQRQLAAEGQTFARILDDVRRSAATRYLTLTDLPLGQIADMVGFDEQASLSRAFQRWYGVSPRAHRDRTQHLT